MKIITCLLSLSLLILANSCSEVQDEGIITYTSSQATTSYVVFDGESSKWFQPKQQQGSEVLKSRYLFKEQKYNYAVSILDLPKFKAFHRVSPWEGYVKVPGNQRKSILGFNCKSTEVVGSNNKRLFLVWHTDRIQPGVGPGKWWGFNGAVLKVVDLLNDKIIFEAISVDLDFQGDVLSVPDTTNMVSLKDLQYLES